MRAQYSLRLSIAAMTLITVMFIAGIFSGCSGDSSAQFDPKALLSQALQRAVVTASISSSQGRTCFHFSVADSSGMVLIGTEQGAIVRVASPCLDSAHIASALAGRPIVPLDSVTTTTTHEGQ